MRVDINCDMGESFGAYEIGADREILPHVTSANIACGFHGGDPRVMRETVAEAKALALGSGAVIRIEKSISGAVYRIRSQSKRVLLGIGPASNGTTGTIDIPLSGELLTERRVPRVNLLLGDKPMTFRADVGQS